MSKRLYVSAILAVVFTAGYLIWLRELSAPMPLLSGWLFMAIFVVGLAFGMNSHQPGYAYLVPITFALAFIFFLLLSLIFTLVRRRMRQT